MPLLDQDVQQYTVSAARHVSVAVNRGGSLPLIEGGRLVDVTELAARFALPAMLHAGDPVTLKISSDDQALDWSLAGAVTWARPDKNLDQWMIRCKFDQPLDAHELDRLMEKGILDRRRAERHLIPLKGLARWEGMPNASDAILVDVSTGGFSFAAPTAGAVGGLVQLSLSTPEFQGTFDGRICWTRSEDGLFRMGCQFLEKSPPAALRLIEIHLSQYHKIESAPPASPAKSSGIGAKIARLFGRQK